MATSGGTTVVVTDWDTLDFEWTLASQSIDNNTSTVNWKLSLVSGAYGKINSTASKSWKVNMHGLVFEYSGTTTIGIANNSRKTLASGSTTIPHASDGSRTFYYSFTVHFDIVFSGKSIGAIVGAGSGTLPTIPRISGLTASDGTLGTAQTLGISREDSTFKHKITYVCGDKSGYAAGSSSTFTTATSVSWTPPVSLATENTTGTSVAITLYLKTYNSSGTELGSTSKTITCAIPASVKPTCTLTVTDPTGYTDTYGNPVQGLSTFKVVVAPTLAYGSPIASYSTTVNDTKYTAASFTTGALKVSGSHTISTTVKDKRGRSASASVTKTVLAYVQPVIAKLTVRRCNEDGSTNDQGEFVQATFTATVTALNNLNKAQYTLKYKKTGEATWTEVGLDDISGAYSVTDHTYIFPADSGSSYNVELDVVDNHNTTKRATSASTAFTLIHWKADGTGMAIGKIAEESNLFDVGLPARFVGAVCGNVMGLNKLPEIPANSDLNDYMDTGSYAVYRNDNAATIANMPVERAGRLEVSSSTGEGIRVTQWSYIRQKFIPYNIENAVWERDITRSDTNIWTYGEWYRTSLSKAASQRVYGGSTILWEGGRYMTADHTINLAEAVSAQPNGIVLTFCKYADGAAQDNNFNHFFVPKLFVSEMTGYGSAFTMMDINFGQICHKYLYINDTTISGHANNSASGTGASGITYDNSKYVLRYVFGV